MKKKLNNNIEIYNYLNITNRNLGKMYKYTGTHCLPPDFDVNEQAFKERILLNEMQNSEVFPPFINEDKKVIKKRLKTSLKNVQKFKKYAKNAPFLQNFSEKFIKKLSLYLELRHDLLHALLKDFESQDCDEVEIYRQIFNLDPVFSEMFESLFDDKPNFDLLLNDLEKKYDKSYQEKLILLEKQNEKRRKMAAQKQLENENLQRARKKTSAKTNSTQHVASAKKIEKTAKNAQKKQNLKDAEKVRAENKQKSTQIKKQSSSKKLTK